MNVEVDTLPNCLATLRVEVPSEKVTQIWDTVAREFSQYAKLPGFRPGRVPHNVVELKFKKQIREEVQQKVKAKYPDLQLDISLKLGSQAAYAQAK